MIKEDSEQSQAHQQKIEHAVLSCSPDNSILVNQRLKCVSTATEHCRISWVKASRAQPA